MTENVTVNYNDTGKVYPADMLIKDIASEHRDDYKYDIIAAIRDGKVTELNKKIKRDCTLSFVDTSSEIGHNVYVRGVTMIMLKAVYDIIEFKKINKVSVESTINNGFYCEFDGDVVLSDELIKQIEEKMYEYVERDILFNKTVMSTDDAIALFDRYRMYDKEKLFRFRRSSVVNVYELDGFYDYYYGAMPPSTGVLKYFSLEKYGSGIVLVVPVKEKPDEIKPFVPSPKFYSVIKESDEWGKSLNVGTVGDLNEAISQGRINDIIMIHEALHEKRIGDIAADIVKRNNVKFVMIAGPSSSGKTTFSHRLSIQLSTMGYNPHPIPVDDYFLNRVNTPLNEDGSYNYECLEAIDVEQFNKDMTALLRGEEVELPTYNFITGQREYQGKKKKLGDNDILVIEGIHGLNDKMSYSLPKESKYKIYISALTQLNIDEHNHIPTADGRLLRRIVRDARTRGSDATKTIAMWQSVRRGESQYIFPFKEEADAMFNSALVYEFAILKQYAEPLLFQVDRKSKEYVEAKRLLKFLDYFLGVSSENIAYNSILREFIGKSVFPV